MRCRIASARFRFAWVVAVFLGAASLFFQVASASVVITHWKHSSGARDNMVRMLAEEFMAENPEIEVRVEVMSEGEFLDKVLVALAGGSGPDTVQVRSTWVPWLVQAKALQPLHEAVLPYAQLEEEYVPGTIRQFQVDGKYYAVPTDAQTIVLFRQPHIFSEAGLNADGPPETWEELAEAARRIHRRDGEGLTQMMGAATGGYGPAIFSLMLQAGSPLWDAERGEPDFDSPEAIKGFSFATDLVTEYGVEDPAFGSRWTAFRNEKLGMVYAHPAMKGSFLNTHPDLKFAISEIPAPEYGGSTQSLMTSWSLAITAKADGVAATKWIAYLQSAEAQQRWLDLTGELPTLWSVIKDPINLEDPDQRSIMFSMMNSAGVPWVSDAMDGIIRDAWSKVINLSEPVNYAIETAQQEAVVAESEARKAEI